MTMREIQFMAQDQRCFYCQRLSHIDAMTWEHCTPRRITGLRRRQDRRNCMLAHARCNKSRGSMINGSGLFNRWIKRVINDGIEYADRWLVTRKQSAHARYDKNKIERELLYGEQN